MTDDEIHALSGAYAVDALDDLERRRFEAHLADCGECRDEVDSLRAGAALLAELTATPPPPALRERVLSDITRVRPLPPEHPEPAASRSRRGLFLFTVAASVLLILGLVVSITRPWGDGNRGDDGTNGGDRLTATEQVLAATDAQRVRLELDAKTTATVVRSKEVGRAVIVTEGMGAAPDGKAYEVWLQTADGEMEPAGMMPDGPDHTMLLEGDATEAVGAGITIEPDGGSPEPTSDPIAYFDFAEADA